MTPTDPQPPITQRRNAAPVVFAAWAVVGVLIYVAIAYVFTRTVNDTTAIADVFARVLNNAPAARALATLGSCRIPSEHETLHIIVVPVTNRAEPAHDRLELACMYLGPKGAYYRRDQESTPTRRTP